MGQGLGPSLLRGRPRLTTLAAGVPPLPWDTMADSPWLLGSLPPAWESQADSLGFWSWLGPASALMSE